MPEIERRLLAVSRGLLEDFRSVVINGPRQSGKSTLLAQIQHGRGRILNLDQPTSLSAAIDDPIGFLDELPTRVAIDEFQRGGDRLLLALKARIDASNERGQYLLAGSTRFLTTRRLSETLTGRVAIGELMPLSVGEIRSSGTSFVDAAFARSAAEHLLGATYVDHSRADYAEMIASGGFPELVLGAQTNRFRSAWVRSYLSTVTALTNVEQVAEVRRPALVGDLVRQMAARSAQEIVIADLSRELQTDEGTIRTYLDILSTLYLVRLVPAWSSSQTNRAKKRPVGHLVDTALACGILGVTAQQLADVACPWTGPLLESFVVGEITKQIGWSDIDVRLSHYRDRDQREIDVVLEHGTSVVGLETKATSTPLAQHARHLAALRDRIGLRFNLGIVLHTGATVEALGDRLVALPISSLWSV